MKRTVMIVDDSRVNQAYLKSILLTNGFEVLEAGRGGEALEMIEANVPDLMILDLNMPGIGGMETLKSIRAKGFVFPIIIFTSDNKDEVKHKCLEAGATDILFKPSKPNIIIRAISKILISPNIPEKD